jgi:hypothetical protein
MIQHPTFPTDIISPNMHKSFKLDVFGRPVLAVRSENDWQMFYLSVDGKRRPAHDLIVPPFVAESELISYLDDLCHEWATDRHSGVRPLDES